MGRYKRELRKWADTKENYTFANQFDEYLSILKFVSDVTFQASFPACFMSLNDGSLYDFDLSPNDPAFCSGVNGRKSVYPL